MGDNRRRRTEIGLHMPPKRVGQCGTGALVRHYLNFHASHRIECFCGEMREAEAVTRSEVEHAGPGVCECNEVTQVFCLH